MIARLWLRLRHNDGRQIGGRGRGRRRRRRCRSGWWRRQIGWSWRRGRRRCGGWWWGWQVGGHRCLWRWRWQIGGHRCGWWQVGRCGRRCRRRRAGYHKGNHRLGIVVAVAMFGFRVPLELFQRQVGDIGNGQGQ